MPSLTETLRFSNLRQEPLQFLSSIFEDSGAIKQKTSKGIYWQECPLHMITKMEVIHENRLVFNTLFPKNLTLISEGSHP